jgi:hypothetical protein
MMSLRAASRQVRSLARVASAPAPARAAPARQLSSTPVVPGAAKDAAVALVKPAAQEAPKAAPAAPVKGGSSLFQRLTSFLVGSAIGFG